MKKAIDINLSDRKSFAENIDKKKNTRPSNNDLLVSISSKFQRAMNDYFDFDCGTNRSIEALTGMNVWDAFDQMDEKDGTIYSKKQTRIKGVEAVEYNLLPVDDSVQAGKVKDFIDDFFFSNWNYPRIVSLMNTLMEGKVYGTSMVEVMWKKDRKGYYIPTSYERLSGKRYAYDNNKKEYFLSDGFNRVDLPQYKVLIQLGDKRPENPFGIGLMHRAFWVFFLKNQAFKYWALYCEKFGMPTVLGEHMGSLSDEEKQRFLYLLRAVQTDQAILKSHKLKIELLEAARQSGADYKNLIAYCDREYNQIFLGQELTTEIGKTGSYSQARVHEDVRHEYVVTDWLDIKGNIQRLIDWITELNFGNSELAPIIEPELSRAKDLDLYLDSVEKAQNVGVDVSREEVYDKLGWREPEKNDILAPGKDKDKGKDDELKMLTDLDNIGDEQLGRTEIPFSEQVMAYDDMINVFHKIIEDVVKNP